MPRVAGVIGTLRGRHVKRPLTTLVLGAGASCSHGFPTGVVVHGARSPVVGANVVHLIHRRAATSSAAAAEEEAVAVVDGAAPSPF